MPQLITKDEALEKLRKERAPGECLICAMNKNTAYLLKEDKHSKVMLSEYPRFWGHAIITLKRHVEQQSRVSETENSALFSNAHAAAKAIEQLLKPSRCYIAALGSEQSLINTCPHIHVNVIPVYDKSMKPSGVFTWENGITTGSQKEWETLCNSMRSTLPAV
ncbi:MAG: hypothetical protein JWO44_1163 [Bacteroidetes bacterium]|nr:hypothetical protein [Bacteroidota bacterium]